MLILLWFHRGLYRCLSNSIADYVAQLCISLLIFWRRQWHPTLVLLPGKSHGWRSLVGCSPWGHEESDMTELLHFHFSLSCTGEGNGNPLQYSCLENPRDSGAWWAAIYGVTQSWTRLKWRSSSSSLYQKKGHKMSTGLQGQKILYTTLFMGKVCRKNPGFDKDKTDVMFGLTMTLHLSFPSMYK